MTIYCCPKCKQSDKGFSRQEIIATQVTNDLEFDKNVPELCTNPEIIDGTALFYCCQEECEWSGGPKDLEEVVVNG